MTAEIAIMNREAVALAADSAVTMGKEGEGGQKVFTSANKLFALSKYYPVGIMVYGRASFIGVPWETIVKIYRGRLGKQKFDTLTEYADSFIAFLDGHNPLFPESEQKEHLHGTTKSYFSYQIRKDIDSEVQSIIGRQGKFADAQIKEITPRVIKRHYDKWENAKMLPSIPKTHIKDIIDKYSDTIDEAIKDVFEKLPISAGSLTQLRKISASLFAKDIFPANISGVAIAGFGENEPFPSLKSFDVEAIVNDRLKYKERYSDSAKERAAIIPFAQREMVDTFMAGIAPDLREYVEDNLAGLLNKYAEIVVENIEQFDDKEKADALKKLKQANRNIFKHYQKRLAEYVRTKYVAPVMDVVIAGLPKDELATMAEALVNLTSFRRKITMGTETVAGPIDVALISKGDGFIWIKRKHYFAPELNPQFFAKYYREAENEEK